MIRKRNLVIFSVFLIFAFSNFGCGNPDNKITIQPDSNSQPMVSSRTTSLGEQNDSQISGIESRLPYPWYVHRILSVFVDVGINSYYSLNKRVPSTFDEYLKSGIPMLIPNDYASGKTYHLANAIDLNDTSGFTFTSDGIETCAFEFVILNNKTNLNEIKTISFDQSSFKDYKNGMFSKTDYYFDKVKREFCVQFFTNYGYIYLMKHDGNAPANLAEMLKNEGVPIESGWKWAPEASSNEYFEYGIDTSKLRSYHIQASKRKPAGELSIAVQQMHKDVSVNITPELGSERWSYSNRESVPSDIIEMNKFISSDAFYEGYLQLVQ